MKLWTAGLAATAAVFAAGAVAAQEAPAMARIQEEGPQWGAFARDSQRVYLVDTAAIARDGDVAKGTIARVRRQADAGDFSHVVDVFEIQCSAKQSRLTSSMSVEEDGETGDAETIAEPWLPIRAGSLDSQVGEILCGDMTPTGLRYPTIQAYIEAGRP